MPSELSYTAVLDIGKTHVKLQLIDANGNADSSFQCKNRPRTEGAYPHADVDGIWQWLVQSLQEGDVSPHIKRIAITTHGATAALIDASRQGLHENGLVLPVLDYEYTGVDGCLSDYLKLRPAFAQSYSPLLPAGLNLGKQLFWLQQSFPDAFEQASHILMYPQYWAWRLTGVLSTEVTSLGCHTDLWLPAQKAYSPLSQTMGWQAKFPELVPAWQVLGRITPELAANTGLPTDCEVVAGVHDSNASYLRYLLQPGDEPFTVISTGTWTILMQNQTDTALLNGERDMLANVDIQGNPVACARFMGGREYERICHLLGSDMSLEVSAESVQQAITQAWTVTPDFSEGNGPFAGLTPKLDCPEQHTDARAIATLYCALMIDQRLQDLDSKGRIYIEGAFLKNPILCQLVAQLRPEQAVYISSDNTGTVQGAAWLSKDDPMHGAPELVMESCLPSAFDGLQAYKECWYQRIHAK